MMVNPVPERKSNSPTYLVSLIIIAGVIFSSLFVLRPKVEEIFQLRNEETVLREKLAKLTKKLNTLRGLDQKELENRASTALKTLPAELDPSYTLFIVRTLANDAGIEIEDISFSSFSTATDTSKLKKSKTAGLPSLELTFNGSGGLDQYQSFLEKIKGTIPLIRAIKVAADTREGWQMEAKINFEAYFLPLPTTLGEAEKPIEVINDKEEKIYQEILKFTPLPQEELPLVPAGKENPFTP